LIHNAIDKPPRVAVGYELPVFSRTTGLANWNRFAAVNNEFVDIHMDDEAGRAAGYDSAFGMGNLLWSYLHNVLRDWGGPASRIVSLKCQFRAPNTKGMTVSASGTVTAVADLGTVLEVCVAVRTQDQNGTVLTPGEAVIQIPA